MLSVRDTAEGEVAGVRMVQPPLTADTKRRQSGRQDECFGWNFDFPFSNKF